MEQLMSRLFDFVSFLHCLFASLRALLVLRAVQPERNSACGNKLPRCVRIDRAGEDG